jgi:hypothetical protein
MSEKLDKYTEVSLKGTTLNAESAAKKMLDTKTFTVSDVEFVDFGDGYEKPVLKVEEIDEGIPLNKTNARSLREAFGPDEAGWLGKKFILLIVDRQYENKPTKGLLTKPVEAGPR